MRRHPRIIPLLLALILLFGLSGARAESGADYEWKVIPDWPVTAETQSSDPGSPNSRDELVKQWPQFENDNEIQVVCFEMGWTGMVEGQDFLTPEIEKRTGLKLNYEPMVVNSDEELNAKLNLMVASGDVPDVFFGNATGYSLNIYEKLGQSGAIYDIHPIIENYPFLYNLVMPELTKYKRTDENGEHNWFLPTQTGRGNDLIHNGASGIHLRKDWLELLGMDYPETLVDFETYLRRCRDEIKEVGGQPVIPMTLGEDLWGIGDIENCFYPLGRFGFGCDVESGYKIYNHSYADSEYLRNAAVYLNRLYQDGLLDRESVSMKRESYTQKIASGRVGAMPTSWWDMNTFSDAAKADHPDLMYVLSKPLNPDYQIVERKWTNWIGMYSTLVFSTKVDEEVLDHFLALCDYITTRDGQMLTQAGLPGISYELDENGKYRFTDEFKAATDDLDWNKVAATGVYYWTQLVFNLPVYEDQRAEFPELVREDNWLGFENREQHRNLYDPTMDPPPEYYLEPGPIELEKMKSIDDSKRQMWVDVLQEPDPEKLPAIIASYAAQFKALGIEEIVAERQASIDRIIADLG